MRIFSGSSPTSDAMATGCQNRLRYSPQAEPRSTWVSSQSSSGVGGL